MENNAPQIFSAGTTVVLPTHVLVWSKVRSDRRGSRVHEPTDLPCTPCQNCRRTFFLSPPDVYSRTGFTVKFGLTETRRLRWKNTIKSEHFSPKAMFNRERNIHVKVWCSVVPRATVREHIIHHVPERPRLGDSKSHPMIVFGYGLV